MPGRILITGASGFLGAYCVETFARRGWDVVATGRNVDRYKQAVQAVSCDLLDPNQIPDLVKTARATHLLHLAWNDDPRDRWTAPSNLDWVSASLRLTRAFAQNGGERMIFAGSCAEYEWGHDRFIEDQTPVRPASLYGAAKAHCGQLLGQAAASLGISVAHTRLFFCYGHGEAEGRLLPDLLKGLEAGIDVPCTDGHQRRDYLYAGDIAMALALVAESEQSGPINICSGLAIRVRDLIETAAVLMERPHIPQFGAISRPAGDPDIIEGDASRLKALGFKPEFTLSKGVVDTLRRRRENPA